MRDPNTGMPQLPEGHFWRINRGVGSEYIWIQIRRRRWWGSRKVAYTVLEKSEVSASRVFERAASAARRFNPDSDYRKFVGDYPPRVLVVEAGEET